MPIPATIDDLFVLLTDSATDLCMFRNKKTGQVYFGFFGEYDIPVPENIRLAYLAWCERTDNANPDNRQP